MRPEQERVKNLLSDTVTLLCKNGLTYKDELRVEALIGITLDNSDVFIVHINEKFDSKGEKSGGDDILSPESAKQEVFSQTQSAAGESLPESTSPTDDGTLGSRKNDLLNEIQGQGTRLEECPKPSRSSVSDVGSDRADSSSTVKELAALEHSSVVIKIEDEEEQHQQDAWGDVQALKSPDAIAQRALMIAGQRRAPLKRPYMTAQQCHDAEAMRQTYSTFNLTDTVNKNNGKMWGDMEPPVKRQSLDEYYLVPTEQGEMAAQMMFDPNNSHLLSPDGSRAGCSSWSSGGATPRTGLQSDMTQRYGQDVSESPYFTDPTQHSNYPASSPADLKLRRSVSSEAKFPNFALVNYHAKEPLMRHIVEPVVNQGGLVCSFRLGWFGKSGEVLEDVWQQLVYLRSIVDAQVCETPGVAFVMSALSGTVSQKAGFPRKTYPAVAYWIASQDHTFQEACILPKMHNLNLGSTVKQLHSTNNTDKQKMASSLFVVVKDNSESYVRRMADASALMYEGDKTLPSERHPIVKVFVKDARYWGLLEEAKNQLEQVNFCFNLEKIF